MSSWQGNSPKGMLFQPQKILIVCPIGLGNYLLATPSIRLLKRAWPQAELHLLSLKTVITGLAEKNPLITMVIDLDANQRRVKNVWRLVNTLRSEKYDASFTLFPSNRWEYNVLPFVSGIARRFAFAYVKNGPETLSYFQNQEINVSESLSDVEQNLALVCYATGVEKPKNISIDFPSVDEAPAVEYLKKHHLLGKKLVGFHPGSSPEREMAHKRWPAGHFSKLARMLAEQHGCHVLVFGGPDEKSLKDEVAIGSAGAATVVEAMDLFKTAALIKQCRLFVANDSGLLHVAAALGVRCAGIFGPTDERRTAPWGKGHIVMGKPMPCRPCWRTDNVGKREKCRKGHVPCLQALHAEEVCGALNGFVREE